MVLRTLLIPKGHKKWDEGKKNSSTQVKKGERRKGLISGTKKKEMKGRMTRQHKSKREREEKDSKFQNTFMCVECNICELSIYRKSSQLIYENLWEQVIHIIDLLQKYHKFSTKYIILGTKYIFWVQKYIIERQNICLITYKNIFDCIPKYIRLCSKIL
jgi:hypothetical protein